MATELQQAVSAQTKAFNQLLGKQNTQQEGLFKGYETTLANQEKLPVLWQRLQSEAGLPDLQATAQTFKDQIFGVKNLLDRLDEDVSTRTGGTFTNEAQRNRQIAAEGDPLRTQLSRLGTGLQPVSDLITSAQGNVSTLLNLTTQQQAKELQPQEMRINAVSDRFAREISGFTATKQNELNALMDKIQRKRDLDDREWQRAQDLAKEEREFSRQKQLVAQQNAGLSYGGGGGGGAKPPANMSQRSDGGFNFTDKAGKPISALKYAQITGTPVLNVLRSMGQSGDQYAARAYNWFNSQWGRGLGNLKKTPAYTNTFRSLTWGT